MFRRFGLEESGVVERMSCEDLDSVSFEADGDNAADRVNELSSFFDFEFNPAVVRLEVDLDPLLLYLLIVVIDEAEPLRVS